MSPRPCRTVPPWWPEDEPWPPHKGPPWRRAPGGRRRRLFLGRVALVLLIVGSLASYGATRLVGRLLGEGTGTGGMAAAAIAFIVIAVVFAVTMSRVGRPMGDIVAASERVADGDFSVRVAAHGPPWLRSVASAFNAMTARLARQQQQRRDLMADIAHELRTPLTAMQGRLEGMLDGVYPRDERHVGRVLEDARLLARLVEDLRTLAHSESGTLALQTEPTDVAVLLDDTAAALAPEATARGVVVDVRVPADLPLIDVDPARVREAVTNLIVNALRHAPPGTPVALVARAREPGGIEIRVTDSGPGIPADALPHVFDRFYKGPASAGSGLGLTIARSLVEAHGGGVSVESREGAGTTITVILPATLGV